MWHTYNITYNTYSTLKETVTGTATISQYLFAGSDLLALLVAWTPVSQCSSGIAIHDEMGRPVSDKEVAQHSPALAFEEWHAIELRQVGGAQLQ